MGRGPSSFISVPSWRNFQHYKDRDPRWIKLHRELLDDYDFSLLEDAARSHLLLIWLLAARHDNRIPNDAKWIGHAIRASTPVDLDRFIAGGFVVVVGADGSQDPQPPAPADASPDASASNLLAGCSRSASNLLAQSRVEESRVEERRGEPAAPRVDAPASPWPVDPDVEVALLPWVECAADALGVAPIDIELQARKRIGFMVGSNGPAGAEIVACALGQMVSKWPAPKEPFSDVGGVLRYLAGWVGRVGDEDLTRYRQRRDGNIGALVDEPYYGPDGRVTRGKYKGMTEEEEFDAKCPVSRERDAAERARGWG